MGLLLFWCIASVPVRGYFVQSLSVEVSLPASGEARYSQYTPGGRNVGTGTRATPMVVYPGWWDVEVGLVIHDRYRVGLTGGNFVEGTAYFGYDVAHVLETRPDRFGAFTVWAGAGYGTMLEPLTSTQLDGPLIAARGTFEFRSGYFIVRPEVFVRVQLVTKYQTPDYEGGFNTSDFTRTAPAVQLGVKLGFGVMGPR